MPATLKDIAKDANVAMSTVSYVLSGTGIHKVSEDTCKRILASAKRLHYRPNIKARGLSKGRTYMVGALIRQLTTSFIPEIIQGLEKVLEDNGCCLILSTYTDSTEFTRKCNYLYQHGVEGVAVLPEEDLPEPNTGDLGLNRIPVVSIASTLADYPKVWVDPLAVGRMALRYLAELGHREIAYGGTLLPRLQGMLELARHYPGLRCRCQGDLTYRPVGGETLLAWLRTLEPFPTAVITDSDIDAIALIQAATRTGIRVPEDLSVVGVDDLEVGRYSLPALTSIGQPKLDQGARAAELLLDAIDGREIHDCILQPFLVERQSCRKRTN